MALGELTSRQAILDAIAEFDQLGRDPFLAKYGFGRSRAYFVLHEGHSYDSKALAGAAHGFQFPEWGPLEAADFSGGERTVANRLRELGFVVSGEEPAEDVEGAAPRNPAWTSDELILALDFYVRHRPTFPSQSSAEIAELSDLLNRLSAARGGRFGTTYRNANGVYMKLMNFRRFDPEDIAAGGRGLKAGGRGDKEVWDRFFADPQGLDRVARAIRAAISTGDVPKAPDPDLEETMTEAPEGAVMTRLHQIRERNRVLVKKCKERALKRYRELRCEACGFCFAERYGEIGQSYIECHHTRPVSTLQPSETTKLADLALLCANCHRMVHARRPWLSMDELRRILRDD